MENNKKLVDAVSTDDAQVTEVLAKLGISDGSKVIVVAGKAMKVGDEFEITGVDKVGNTTSEDFIPFIFTCSNGKSIGCKNFADIEWPKGVVAPTLGRTASEVVRFGLWSQSNHIKYVVERIKLGEERTLPDGTKYTPKEITLSV
jgi:hypothetical protein